MSGDGNIVVISRGLRWHAHRLDELSTGRGVFITFHPMEQRFDVGASDDILESLRSAWWKKNFWNFSWFKLESSEHAKEMKKRIQGMEYDEAWNFKGSF